ncbi:TrbI F-type domain-containing protein [Pseudoalteromonas luteoviolacea]|uniref:TrbI F-type domain-containing protein n=1 Tax=Pseudoalteromonas luteoviolacea TaxID=43657 RepID=UPI001B373102|nr:TrbI F-type domain-containing protein [Pseudoalteromonas luteoviolacea]MBQ4839998.1 TrbI F-type domain-containing protein [Pseudoalteromonas luteoviolacea]
MKNVVVSLICGLLGAMVFTLANNHLYSRTVAVVKLDEIIAGHLTEFGEKELSDDERKEISEAFAKSLDQVIKRIGEEEKVTLLVAPAVVSDVPDYTAYVQAEVKRMVGNE